jgi:calpain-15
LRLITGGIIEFFHHDYYEKDIIFNKIKTADKLKYIICASAGKEESTKDYSQEGLVSTHAYALISVHNPLTEEGRVQLLKLRNPWGRTEWQGDWSDKSDKWTPALKEELGWSDANDGMFFIPFDDYLNFYNSTTICKVHDDYHYNSISTKQEKDSHTFFTFELDDDSYIDLTVSQVAERMVNKKYGY